MIGLFGGTFNPVHYGHLLICEGMQEEFNLKKVVFIPAKVPPHKDKGEIVKADHRLKMVKLATKDNPHFEVSDIEMKREGYSYTVDTLRLFNNIYPNDDIGLIVGADSLVNFDTWREYQKIFELANILVSSRPDIDNSILDSTILRFKNQFGAKIFKYSTRVMDYSSTEIRRRITRGLSIKYLVPQIVEEYIYKNRLYNVNSTEGIYGN